MINREPTPNMYYRFWIKWHHGSKYCKWRVWAKSRQEAIEKLPHCVDWKLRSRRCRMYRLES